MSSTKNSVASSLNALIEICREGEDRFQHSAENSGAADLRVLFAEISAQWQQFAIELKHLVRGLSENSDGGHPIADALHIGWIDFKAVLMVGNEKAILGECARGEEAAIAKYAEVLDRDDLPTNVRNAVRKQLMAVQASYDAVRELRARFSN